LKRKAKAAYNRAPWAWLVLGDTSLWRGAKGGNVWNVCPVGNFFIEGYYKREGSHIDRVYMAKSLNT